MEQCARRQQVADVQQAQCQRVRVHAGVDPTEQAGGFGDEAATGRAGAAEFVYTIDQAGTRATTGAPAGWTKKDTCWVDRKDGACTQ